MKKKLLLIFSVFLFLFYSCSRKEQQKMPGQDINPADTIRARGYLNSGDQLKWANPDSASVLYHEAITLLQPYVDHEQVEATIALCYCGIVVVNIYNGNYELAAKYDSVVERIGISSGNKDLIAQAYLNRGLLFFNQSDYSSALEYYGKAEALCHESGNRKMQAKIYTNTAIICYYQGNLEKAREYFSKTMTVALEMGDDELLSGSYINQGRVAQYAGDIQLAVDNYQKAIEVSTRINDENGIVICYQNIGSIWFNSSNFVRALEAYQESLQRALKLGDQSNISKDYHNMGEVYAFLGDYEVAINYYIQSAQIKKQLNDLQGMASVYSSIGGLNYQRGEYRQALVYHQKALDIDLKLKFMQGLARDYANLGNVYLQMEQYDKGIGLALKSLELHQQLSYEDGLVDLYSILGSLYAGKADYETAMPYLNKSLAKSKEAGDKTGMASAMNGLGNLVLTEAGKLTGNERTDLYSKAMEYGKKALALSKASQALPIQWESAQLLVSAYKKAGNFEKALEFSEESRNINDSILSSEKNKALILAETKWNAEQRQQKIEQLEQEKQLQDDAIRQKEKSSRLKNTIIGLLMFIMLLILTSAFFAFMYIRKRRDILFQQQLASMTLLKMQNIRNRMSPHFFFNVLNAVSVDADQPELVRKNLGRLSLLLRKSIENIEQTAVSLREEIDVVKAFIELQRQRIPEPFEVDFSVRPGIDLKRLVLAMMIQIPVENAIKHGLMPLPGLKKLQIAVEEKEKDLIVLIRDNGVGLAVSSGRSTGTGTGLKVLLQTISLLNQKNKDKIEFSVNKDPDSEAQQAGTVVRILIPVNFSFN